MSSSESRNPYAQRGVDYVKSLRIVVEAYRDGKIEEINEETIAKYSKKVPLENTCNVEIATAVTEKVNNSNVEELVNNSEFSKFSKDILINSFAPDADIEALVDKVLKHELPETEKEFVLTHLAIIYSILNNSQNISARKLNCAVNGQPVSCAAAGALSGLIIGAVICGIFCALGGALVGGLAGSVSD